MLRLNNHLWADAGSPQVVHWQRLLLAGFFTLLTSGCATQSPQSVDPGIASFSITHTNPATLVNPKAFGYSQIVTVSNGRTIFLAGQGPTKLNEKSPQDLRGQTRNAVDNVLLALAAVGAGPENIVYLRINVVDYNPKMLIDIAPELRRLTAIDGEPPASVFVGVSSLVLPSTMIEIETVAAVP